MRNQVLTLLNIILHTRTEVKCVEKVLLVSFTLISKLILINLSNK